MADVFISYARENSSRAELIADALRRESLSVFWDRTIPPGQAWREYLGNQLALAGCVVVLWSEASVGSHYVLEEAEDARQRKILVPVLIEAQLPPFGFRTIQAADLANWQGSSDHQQFQQLVSAIRSLTKAVDARTARREPVSPALSQPLEKNATPVGSPSETKPLEHIFLATGFAERDRDLTGNVEALLTSHDIGVTLGINLTGSVLSEEIRQRISQTDAVIALLTRRDKRPDGLWSTYPWVLDEVVLAQSLGKPTAVVVEEGVRGPGLSIAIQAIHYQSDDSPRTLIALSQVVREWKTRAGKTLRVALEPQELVRSLAAKEGMKCRYRIAVEGEFTDWRAAVLIREPGGAFVYLQVPREGFHVQIEVSDGEATWTSSLFGETVSAQLSRD